MTNLNSTNVGTKLDSSVREKSEIEREIDGLENLVVRVQDQLVLLANRLTSVMSSSPEAESTCSSPRPVLHSPLGITISQIAGRVDSVSGHITYLMDRIKL